MLKLVDENRGEFSWQMRELGSVSKVLRRCMGVAGVSIMARGAIFCQRDGAKGCLRVRSGCVVVLEGEFVDCEVGGDFCS